MNMFTGQGRGNSSREIVFRYVLNYVLNHQLDKIVNIFLTG